MIYCINDPMDEASPNVPEGREYYPYVTQRLLRLYGKGVLTNVVNVVVEPEYGYVTRISYTDGSYRVTYGNDLGLNSGAASELARDKGHTKFLLRALGVNCPRGAEFLLPWYADVITPSQVKRGNKSIRTTVMAESYINDELGYPVYVKPVDGSKGINVFDVHSSDELNEVLDLYATNRIRLAMIEEPIQMPDYRVVTLDGELISAYRRIPLKVIGNGENTIRELIDQLQREYDDQERDTVLDPEDHRISRYISRQGLTIEDTPRLGEEIVLVPISNLSTGGRSEDVTDKIDLKWQDLAAYVAKNFNLRLCGVDLACEDILDSQSNYSVLEVNSAPGLDHYASSGLAQKRLVDDLYSKVFNTSPNPPQAPIN